MKVTILGSGTSHGVPMIGCSCAVCTSLDPRNRRTRASALVQFDHRNVLIDTSIDLRRQALAAGLQRVDAILFTHQHADHICGFDDVRRFCAIQRACIPCYGNDRTIQRLRHVFDYVLDSVEHDFFDVPVVAFNIVDRPFLLFGRTVIPVPLVHGRWPCFGYRLGNFAYCTDVKEIPPESMELLRGLDTLVLGALRMRPHPTHFSLEQALAVIAELRPRRAYLTHIAHDLDHQTTNAALPADVQLAYDGLVIDVDS